MSGRAKHELLAGSRVLLNVHQGERDYFEWIRVLEAISNGCLVVTERSGGYAPLVPGRHFIQAPADAAGGPGRRDPAGRSPAGRTGARRLRVRAQEHGLGRQRGPLAHPGRASPVTRDGPGRAELPRRRRLPETFRRPGTTGTSATAERSPPVPAVKSQVSALFDQAEAHEKQGRSMIKDILLAEVNDSRLIEATIAALEHGSQEYAQVSDTPAISGPRRRCRSSSPTTTIRRSCARRSSRWSPARGSGWSSSWSTTTPTTRSWSTCVPSSLNTNGSRSVWSPMPPTRARRRRATSAPVMPGRRCSSCSTPTTCSTPRGPSCSTPRSTRAMRPLPTG